MQQAKAYFEAKSILAESIAEQGFQVAQGTELQHRYFYPLKEQPGDEVRTGYVVLAETLQGILGQALL